MTLGLTIVIINNTFIPMTLIMGMSRVTECQDYRTQRNSVLVTTGRQSRGETIS